MSAFDIFNNSIVKIGSLKRGEDYGDDEPKFIEECEISGDLQPYNGGLAQREYGIEEEVTAKLYTKTNESITAGKTAEINNVKYDIVYALHWDFGTVALLRKREI